MANNDGMIRIELHNFANLYYYGDLTVGTPSITLPACYDTGSSSEVWIPGRNLGPNFVRQKYHDFGAPSNTQIRVPATRAVVRLRERVTLNAIRKTDTISFDNHNVEFRSVVCDIYHAEPITYHQHRFFTSVVGLSFRTPTDESTLYLGPIWENMNNERLLGRGIFSVYLKDFFHFGNDDGGEIIFGGADPAHYGDQHRYFSVIDGFDSWTIELSDIVVGAATVRHPPKALIDTGSPFIYGPRSVIHRINTLILGRLAPRLERVVFTAEDIARGYDMPTVSFTFLGDEGPPFDLTPVEYMVPIAFEEGGGHTSIFRPMVFEQGTEECMVLGVPFLRMYHTIFSFLTREIGFATAVHHVSSDEEDGVEEEEEEEDQEIGPFLPNLLGGDGEEEEEEEEDQEIGPFLPNILGGGGEEQDDEEEDE